MKLKHMRAYMECAQSFAKCSESSRLQVGAVIVKHNRIISCGYNALPEHIDGPMEDDLGLTLPTVRHAEKNALMGLTKSHESAQGSTMFCTHSCCQLCAVDIVDAGITKFIFRQEYRDRAGLEYLLGHGVEVEHFISPSLAPEPLFFLENGFLSRA